MKKLLITVNGKRYEVDVEIVHDDDAIDVVPSFKPPPRATNSYVTPVNAPLPGKPKSPSVDKKTLISPINGTILEIPVKEGAAVKENDVLFVLEAMKMKTNIASPQNGTIKFIKVKVGETIETGQALITFE
jgi:glutaconyl-CoA/methylmalonyl-CoA decarboxylase subunit gamma